MNNYLRILDHLNKFAGDGKYHELKTLFEDLFLDTPSNSLESIVNEEIRQELHSKIDNFNLLVELLAKDGLIIKHGSMFPTMKITSKPNPVDFIVPKSVAKHIYKEDITDNRSFLTKLLFKKKYVVVDFKLLSAQITPLGMKYLNDMSATNSLNDVPSSNRINQIISLSKDLVKEGSLKLSIESLMEIELTDDHKNILLILLGRLSLIETEDQKGIISFEEKRLTTNKIIHDLIGVINQIEKFRYGT